MLRLDLVDILPQAFCYIQRIFMCIGVMLIPIIIIIIMISSWAFIKLTALVVPGPCDVTLCKIVG